jgi:hypothetical protein
VSAIAAQYEMGGSLEARPFFNSQAARFSGPPPYKTFTSVLPFLGANGANRPTISFTPVDDPEVLRNLLRPSSLDGIVFLSETSWPVSTIFRLWVEYLNRVPNAVTASGPPRELVPQFRDFKHAVELMQVLQDRGALRFVRAEKIVELGPPLPGSSLTPAALVEAEKNGYEYRQHGNDSWVLIKRDRQLELKIEPATAASPEALELCQLLHLRPGVLSYRVTVGSADVFPLAPDPEGSTTFDVTPRSTVQALFYLAHGVMVPPEHLSRGILQPTLEPDGSVFDWQQVLGGLFTVHSVKQCCRPKQAWVAVKYRGYWFYIDDSDYDSKISFTLIMVMARANLTSVPKGGPTLTLPVGR